MNAVLTTGANRGLGFEFSRQYVQAGWKACLLSLCGAGGRFDEVKRFLAAISSCEMAGLVILPSGWSVLLWNREQVYFYATIGCPASGGFVTGNRVLGATAKSGDAGPADSLEDKIVGNAVGARLG